MAENNIRVRADLNPDAIDNADHDDQDPPPPPQNDHDGVVPVPPAAPGAAQTMLAFKWNKAKYRNILDRKERTISQPLCSSGRSRIWLVPIDGTTQ